MMLVIGILAALVLIIVAATLVASWRWRATTVALVAKLDAAAGRSSPPGATAPDLEGVPPPVARYFSAALGANPARVARARIRWSGQFLVRPEGDGWAPFDADQVFTTWSPGLVWDARIRMGPGITTLVRDAFVDGHGSMRAALLGVIPVVNAPRTPELDAAALQRYLAECVWLPTALLPSQGVKWTPLTETSARATIRAGSTEVALDFIFGPDGLVAHVFTPMRFRDVHGTNVPTPWEGRFLRYEERGGMRIPVEAEVAWLLPDKRLTYWRGVPVEVNYIWSSKDPE